MVNPKTLLVAQVFISGMMCFIMTGFFGFIHFGPTAAWLNEWANAFVIGWPIAFCLSLVVGRISFRLARLVTGG